MGKEKKGTVVLDHVSKRYRLGRLGTLRGSVSWLRDRLVHRTGSSEIYALRDVTFRVEPGEALGLIGPNGAGKTTILKLLSSITRPTSGAISMEGRIASLIELGAGFHPELTGRENIFLNGAILGLKRHEIAKRLDEIVAFSELQQFIDTPVKRYSSGMYVRLGFAIAAHVDCDIMLVDEVLSVGDSAFRHRSLQRMRELQRSGVTVLFVSHNMHLVRQTCDRSLLLVKGEVRALGQTLDVIVEYEKLALEGRPTGAAAPGTPVERVEISGLLLKRIAMSNNGNAEPLASHLPAKLAIDYEAIPAIKIGRIDVRILREDSTLCFTVDSTLQTESVTALDVLQGSGTVAISFPALQLTSGTYTAVVQVTDPSDAMVIASGQSEPFAVHSHGNGPNRGIYVPIACWTRTQ